MSDTVLTAPGIFSAALGLIQAAASGQSPAPQVFPFELGQYEPAQYITLHDISPVTLVPEDTQYGFQEHYDLEGEVVVFTGTGVADSSTVTTDTMVTCWNLFQACVMTPFVSSRMIPILGYNASSSGAPGPYQMLIRGATYTAGVGTTAEGQPWGWQGVVALRYHFDSLIYPA